jgi:hypothetical protein
MVQTRTSLCRHSNQSLRAAENSAGKRFGEARDWAAIFGDVRRSRATETALSRVSGGKAAESQRLFRPRQETGIAQDCVVAEAVHIGPVSVELFPANREKNTEIRENRPFGSMLAHFFRRTSKACTQIPCATEQGLFFDITGK